MTSQFELVGRVPGPWRQEDSQSDEFEEPTLDFRRVYMAITSDGSRTVSLFNGRVFIHSNSSHNDSGFLQELKVHQLPRFDLSNDMHYGFHLFDNDTKIVYHPPSSLNILDLETGQQMVSPRVTGNIHGPIKFNKNIILTLKYKKHTLTRISPTFNGLPKQEHAKWAFCHDMTKSEQSDNISQPLKRMDLNPNDFSTMAISDGYGRIVLYDIRRFTLDSNEQLDASLGKVEELASVKKDDDLQVDDIKFSPNGKKIAVVFSNQSMGQDKVTTSLRVYDADDKMAETRGPLLNGNPICWYNDDNVCFVESHKLVCWNVNDNSKNELCPASNGGVYVHPTLPLVANFKLSGIAKRAPIIEIWRK